MILEKIESILRDVELLDAHTAQEVEQLRLKYLSKKGLLNALMEEFRTVKAEEKRAVGTKLNILKTALTDKINTLRAQIITSSTMSYLLMT